MSKLVSLLAGATGLMEGDIRSIVMRAPVSYKHYQIDKRNGDKRDIAQPAREVKKLQRILVSQLAQLPIHDAATAYRTGISIRDNAARHAGNGPILKFDFEAFFPSIRDVDWEEYCIAKQVFSDPRDIELSSRLFFHRAPGSTVLRLAIGAPSSPWLSNVLMYDFDDAISRLVAADKVTYTRYADDLTFSAPRTWHLIDVERSLKRLIREVKSPRLKLNDHKMVMSTKKYRRVVTGLVLADDGRVTLGRDRKRVIRAMLDHAAHGKLTNEELGKLGGLLAFAKDVEPDFFSKIAARYGGDILRRLANAK